MTIVTMRATLTEADIRTLVKGPSEDVRAQAAHKLCRCIDDAELTEEERQHAAGILEIMAKDAAERVRRAMAVTLKNSPKLPRHLAQQLVTDLDSIALPILSFSPSLTDQDLVELVRACPPNRQVAIASRPTLSGDVTGALARFGAPAAVERALSNPGAEFTEGALDTALTRFPDTPAITDAMVQRAVLPARITEKLVTMVSGQMFDHLVNNHALPPQLAIDIAMGSRERATIDLVEQASRQSELRRFVQQLSLHGRLTPSLIMRGLCLGEMRFVEHALAELAGMPHEQMWFMIHDQGPLGLRAAFERSGLPSRLFPSFQAGIEVFHQIERDGGLDDAKRFRARMIERVLTLFQSVPRDDLDYLLEKLNAIEETRGVAVAM